MGHRLNLTETMMIQTEEHSDAPAAIKRGQRSWVQTLVAIPAAVLALLPSFSCPVCIAAYAGVLSSLGLGFVLSDRVQRPLIVFFLTVTLGSVALATKQHKRRGPFLFVLTGSLAIVAGRLLWSVHPALYLGVLCLVAGTVWNLILKRPRRKYVRLGLAEDRRTAG